MKEDWSLIYIMLLFCMVGSYAGPSATDVNKVADEVKALRTEIKAIGNVCNGKGA